MQGAALGSSMFCFGSSDWEIAITQRASQLIGRRRTKRGSSKYRAMFRKILNRCCKGQFCVGEVCVGSIAMLTFVSICLYVLIVHDSCSLLVSVHLDLYLLILIDVCWLLVCLINSFHPYGSWRSTGSLHNANAGARTNSVIVRVTPGQTGSSNQIHIQFMPSGSQHPQVAGRVRHWHTHHKCRPTPLPPHPTLPLNIFGVYFVSHKGEISVSIQYYNSDHWAQLADRKHNIKNRLQIATSTTAISKCSLCGPHCRIGHSTRDAVRRSLYWQIACIIGLLELQSDDCLLRRSRALPRIASSRFVCDVNPSATNEIGHFLRGGAKYSSAKLVLK
jgi:hypothetical protein